MDHWVEQANIMYTLICKKDKVDVTDRWMDKGIDGQTDNLLILLTFYTADFC